MPPFRCKYVHSKEDSIRLVVTAIDVRIAALSDLLCFCKSSLRRCCILSMRSPALFDGLVHFGDALLVQFGGRWGGLSENQPRDDRKGI